MIRTLWQDLRYGTRRLCKTPGFTLITVLTPTLSTGLTQVKTRTAPLDVPSELKPRNVKAEIVTYKGEKRCA